MQNKGIVLRSSLGLKDMQHRILIEGIGAQTVDRLRRNAQQTAVFQNGSRFGNLFGFRKEFGFHQSCSRRSFSA